MPKATRKDIEAARNLVRKRDGTLCQMCGRSIVNRPSSIHHRKSKGMGGSALLESPSNLIRLCGLGNADGCHGEAHGNPEWAYINGWLIRRLVTFAPAHRPVNTYRGWVYLSHDGLAIPAADWEAS